MVKRPSTSSEIAAAVMQLADRGVTEIGAPERRLLARVLVDESQKGAFDPEGPSDEVMQRFIEHARAAFPADGSHLVVRDHRARLSAHAQQLANEHPPVASLILYATAIEHWLNALILTASLQRQVHEEDARVVIRRFTIPEKLRWLQKRFAFPPFEPERQKALQRLVDLRNEYVHYKWIASDHSQLLKRDQDLRDVVAGADELLGYLEQYEFDQLARAGIEAAIAIFRVERTDLVRLNFRRTG